MAGKPEAPAVVEQPAADEARTYTHAEVVALTDGLLQKKVAELGGLHQQALAKSQERVAKLEAMKDLAEMDEETRSTAWTMDSVKREVASTLAESHNLPPALAKALLKADSVAEMKEMAKELRASIQSFKGEIETAMRAGGAASPAAGKPTAGEGLLPRGGGIAPPPQKPTSAQLMTVDSRNMTASALKAHREAVSAAIMSEGLTR